MSCPCLSSTVVSFGLLIVCIYDTVKQKQKKLYFCTNCPSVLLILYSTVSSFWGVVLYKNYYLLLLCIFCVHVCIDMGMLCVCLSLSPSFAFSLCPARSRHYKIWPFSSAELTARDFSSLLISTLPSHSPAFFQKPLRIFSCVTCG